MSAASLTPFGLACVWLVAGLLGTSIVLPPALVGGLFGLVLLTPLLLWMWSRRSPRPRYVQHLAVLSPCFFAPLAVLHTWALIPGPGGLGYASLPTFLHWLTKYPNLGPINSDVLLGILCVLGSSAVPVAFGLLALRPQVHKLALLPVALAWTLPYGALFVHLDGMMWWIGLSGVPTMTGTFRDPSLLFGPILRTLPLLSMGAVMLRRLPEQNNKAPH